MLTTHRFMFGLIVLGLGACASPEPPSLEPVGMGSYATTLPSDAQPPSNRAGEPVLPLVTADFTGPVPTNDWWSSLLWDFADEPYSMDLYPHPLAVRATAKGLLMRYPTEAEVTDAAYYYDRTNDLLVGLEGLDAPDARAADYSDWTVTAAWDDGTRQLEATIGHGLPFVYFRALGGAASVEPQGEPIVWANSSNHAGITINGHHYGLFAPSGASWNGSGTLVSDLNGQDYFSVAVLPDASLETLALFARHAYAFVTDTQVAWQYDEASAEVTTTYTLTTELKESGPEVRNTPLVALYRHQWLHTDAALTDQRYTSSRGDMRVLNASSFQTTLPFGGILPGLVQACSVASVDSTLYGFIDAVYQEDNLFPGNLGNGDTYWSGKGVGRLAELLSLAEDVNHNAARDRFLATIKATLEDWFTAGEGDAQFYYNEPWTTLIGFPADFGSSTDLNDHHFHYGYLIIAAAAVAQREPEWAAPEAWGGMVELLIRDTGNWDRSDLRFPLLRSFDVYAGHSWASGHGGFDDRGNNQESSSEAINYAAGLIRWGAETGNRAIRDLGIYLYVTELSAIEQYWFDVDDAVYPEAFDHTTVAIVWGNGGLYDTWWSRDPEHIHGINYLPYTGASYYLGRHPDYVRANYDELVHRHEGPLNNWPDLALQFLALADAEEASIAYDALLEQGYRPEDGETIAHTYRWIRSLQSLGHVDRTVTADHPFYRVFQNDGKRRYVAYNPNIAEQTVTFSDGFTLAVPGKSQVTACP